MTEIYLVWLSEEGEWLSLKIHPGADVKIGREYKEVVAYLTQEGVEIKKPLAVKDLQVSRIGKQAQFFWYEGSLMVKDLGSTNGTFLNGKPLQGWRRAETSVRYKSEPVKVDAPSTIFFGQNTAVCLTDESEYITIQQDVKIILPLQTVRKKRGLFFEIKKLDSNRTVVLPQGSAKLHLKSGEIVSVTTKEMKEREQKEILTASYTIALAALTATTHQEFDGKIKFLIDKYLKYLQNPPTVVKKLLDQYERVQYFRTYNNSELEISRGEEQLKEILREYKAYCEADFCVH